MINQIDSLGGHVPEEEIRKFRELKESFWELQEFGSGPFQEAEPLPLIFPDFEMDINSARFKVNMTDALELPFETLLARVEGSLNLSGVYGQVLRALLVRVKSRKQIYPHIDETFSDLDCELYRMQIYRSNDDSFLKVDDLEICPEVGSLLRIQKGSVVSEENTGLNDNIHLMLYFKRKSASKVLAEEVAGEQ